MLIADPGKTMALRIFSRLTFVVKSEIPIDLELPVIDDYDAGNSS